MTDAAQELASASSYVSLATFRRSGAEVRTPVWFAPCEGRLVAFSNDAAGKIKRLRHSPRARVAACDVRGQLRGDWREAAARTVEEPERQAAAIAALLRRYGWQFRVVELFARLFGRRRHWAILEIELVETAP